MKRAFSGREVTKMKRPRFEFTGEWADVFGSPGKTGVWFIWGNSGNGKTSFVMQLCKELAKFGRVAYNSLEESTDVTMQDTLTRFGIPELGNRFLLLDCESIEDLEERMNSRKSPDFYVIDSLQYTRMNYRSYQCLKEAHRNKLIIFVSHAKGKEPKGDVAVSIMYDAALKIFIEGYRAITKGRTSGPKGYYTIWDEGARRYWGKKENSEIKNQTEDI